VGGAIVILSPDGGGKENIKGRDLDTLLDSIALLNPFEILIYHRVDDLDEWLVAVEYTIPSGENITLEPAFTGVLAGHFHHTAMVLVGIHQAIHVSFHT
jgi:hypothetical protein